MCQAENVNYECYYDDLDCSDAYLLEFGIDSDVATARRFIFERTGACPKSVVLTVGMILLD